jgi:hypothetical protein
VAPRSSFFQQDAQSSAEEISNLRAALQQLQNQEQPADARPKVFPIIQHRSFIIEDILNRRKTCKILLLYDYSI